MEFMFQIVGHFLFLFVGLVLGYFLDKKKTKTAQKKINKKIKSMRIGKSIKRIRMK